LVTLRRSEPVLPQTLSSRSMSCFQPAVHEPIGPFFLATWLLGQHRRIRWRLLSPARVRPAWTDADSCAFATAMPFWFATAVRNSRLASLASQTKRATAGICPAAAEGHARFDSLRALTLIAAPGSGAAAATVPPGNAHQPSGAEPEGCEAKSALPLSQSA
jgi:hypothetical protein